MTQTDNMVLEINITYRTDILTKLKIKAFHVWFISQNMNILFICFSSRSSKSWKYFVHIFSWYQTLHFLKILEFWNKIIIRIIINLLEEFFQLVFAVNASQKTINFFYFTNWFGRKLLIWLNCSNYLHNHISSGQTLKL